VRGLGKRVRGGGLPSGPVVAGVSGAGEDAVGDEEEGGEEEEGAGDGHESGGGGGRTQMMGSLVEAVAVLLL